jgi:hypothetical protein
MTVKKKVTTTPKPKTKPRAKVQRKELSIEDKHPFSSFPFRLEYRDGNEDRVCHFDCNEHRERYIKRYNLRKNKYTTDDLIVA